MRRDDIHGNMFGCDSIEGFADNQISDWSDIANWETLFLEKLLSELFLGDEPRNFPFADQAGML